MPKANYIEKARNLGYVVEVAQELESGKVYNISGFGIFVHYAEDDTDAWRRLCDPKAHEHRKNFARHIDTEDDFEMSEDAIMKSSFAAQVSLGDMTKKDADEAFKEWQRNVEEARA